MSNIEVPIEIVAELRPGETLTPVQTDDGVEWWLFDEEGELIEAFWFE